jgi:hypothetical protein
MCIRWALVRLAGPRAQQSTATPLCSRVFSLENESTFIDLVSSWPDSKFSGRWTCKALENLTMNTLHANLKDVNGSTPINLSEKRLLINKLVSLDWDAWTRRLLHQNTLNQGRSDFCAHKCRFCSGADLLMPHSSSWLTGHCPSLSLCLCHFTVLSESRSAAQSNARMIDGRWIGKDLEGRGIIPEFFWRYQETHRSVPQYAGSGRDSNRISAKYESRPLGLHQPVWFPCSQCL